jgi:nucleotide-binding universal stress UspA family protein
MHTAKSSLKMNHQTLSHQNKEINFQVLLAFDGSKHAQASISLLNDLNIKNCQITTLSVIPTQQLSGHEKLERAIKKAGKKLSSAGYKVETKLKAGNPAASINDLANEMNADLIVIGAKGLRATLGILLGGVAQQVVEYSRNPVLVVRAPYKGLKHILFVTDGSKSSQLALEYLTPRCEDDVSNSNSFQKHCLWLPSKTNISAMHILPPAISFETSSQAWTVGPEVLYLAPPPSYNKEEIEKEEEKEGNRILSEAVKTLNRANISAKKVLKRGDAATEILNYSKQEEIDLIVCGSRGLSQVTSWLLGSVSRKLIHYSNCSVLVVK